MPNFKSTWNLAPTDPIPIVRRDREDGLRRLLVVVMTNSDEPRDIDRAYDLGANSFLKKPDDFSDLLKMSEKLHEYWIETNLCPTCNSGRRRS